METLINKKIVIVGATGGIGSETAKLLKQSNAELYLCGTDLNKLSELADSLGLPNSRCFQMDIRKHEQVQAVAEKIGTPDILINAAGIGIIKPIEKLEIEEFDKSIDINLKGAFYLLKAFLQGMKEQKKGLIINIPGVLGKTPMSGAAAYSASKYGLNGMLKSIREELKRTEVRITNLYLGGTDTAFWNEIDIPVNRDKFVSAREAARSIWFLCQQPSSGVVSEMVLQPFNHQAI
jgi:NADP-dependent 3-hydroxy acid dehydrogenase YdfG